MEGKLIKVPQGYYLEEVFEPGTRGSAMPQIFASTYGEGYNKLSLTNCQAIERGYDLDELAEKEYLDGYDTTKLCRTCFKDGFQKALELMENELKQLREFARDCAKNWDCDTDGHKYNTGCRCCEAETLLQKTEWDVVIEMESIGRVKTGVGSNTNQMMPKLDENGCLILKRKK